MSAKSPIKPKLVIIEGKDKGKVIPLQDGTVVIGRTKGDVVVQDARVSRSHVAVHYDAKTGKLSFTDLKSLNGTLVNEQAAEAGELHDGDKLQIGDTLFDCQVSEPADEAPRARKKKAAEKESVEEIEAVADALVEANVRPNRLPPEPVMAAPTVVASDDDEEMPVARKARKEPKSMGDDSPRPRGSLFAGLRTTYMKVPRRTRNIGLCALLLGLTYLYSASDSGPLTSMSGALERDLAAVKALESAGQIEEAIGRAEQMRKQYPDHSQTYMTLGSLYAGLRKYEQAIASYRRAKLVKPEQPLAVVRLIQVYLRAGLTQDADGEMRVLDQMMRDGQHSKELFVEAAQLFLEFKDLRQSPEKTLILAKALQNDLAADSPIGYKLEAQVLFSQNRNEEALQTLEKGLKLDPEDEWLLENLAFAKLSLKDLQGAADVVESWIRLKPTATKALLVAAYLKFNDRNLPGALPYVQKILQLGQSAAGDPLYPEALNLMGQIYWQQGQNPEAQGYLRKACEAGFQQSCEHELLRGTASQKPDPSAPSEGAVPPPPPAAPASR